VPIHRLIETTTVADPSRLNFPSPDRKLRSGGPPIARGRSLNAGGRAMPRPQVAGQLRLFIRGENRGCEVETLAEDPPNREDAGSIAGQRRVRPLWKH
jgi:hypothetical protein